MGTETTVQDVERKQSTLHSILGRREFGVTLAVLGLAVVGILLRADVFLTASNISGIIRNAAVVGIIGYGMTILVSAGDFDLSVGSMMALSAGLTATMLVAGFPVELVFVLIFLFAVIYGLLQGILVTKMGIPSLILTIGTLTLLRGVHLIVTDGQTQSLSDSEMPALLHAMGGTISVPQPLGQFPLQIVWLLGLLGLFHYLLFHTPFGYRTLVTGGDEEAARYTGINTDQVKIAGFAIVSVLAAFAGLSQLAFTNSVSPLTGDGVALVVIAAVVIGGTDIFGGEGSIVGTLLGALVFALIQNVLVLAGLGAQLFSVFTGVFVILAVAFDELAQRTRYEKIETLFTDPLRNVATQPFRFFESVDEDVRGITAPLVFLSCICLTMTVFTLAGVLLSVVGVVGFEFSVFIISGGVGALATVPLFVFGAVAGLTFLFVVFLHAVTTLAGSRATIDKSIQAVSYSFAPLVLGVVPLLLLGYGFLSVLVLATAVPSGLAVVFLLARATMSLHGLDTRTAVASAIASTAALLAFFGYLASLA